MLLDADAELPEGTIEIVTVAADVVGLATMISLTTAVVEDGTVYKVLYEVVSCVGPVPRRAGVYVATVVSFPN